MKYINTKRKYDGNRFIWSVYVLNINLFFFIFSILCSRALNRFFPVVFSPASAPSPIPLRPHCALKLNSSSSYLLWKAFNVCFLCYNTINLQINSLSPIQTQNMTANVFRMKVCVCVVSVWIFFHRFCNKTTNIMRKKIFVTYTKVFYYKRVRKKNCGATWK